MTCTAARLRDYLDWYWTQALGGYQEAAAQAADGGCMSGEEPARSRLEMCSSAMANFMTQAVGGAVAFYRDLVGLEQVYRFPEEGGLGHVELSVGAARIGLSGYHAAREVSLPEPSPGHQLELVLWCGDVDSELSRLRAVGARVLVEPCDHVSGHRRASVADPDENWVTLVDEN
jgi:predicted enzyme related to lactoylglutathione lyase